MGNTVNNLKIVGQFSEEIYFIGSTEEVNTASDVICAHVFYHSLYLILIEKLYKT